jgi:hypothetical protein
MVPTCSNPGGMTVPEQRKREIYAVCRRWDVMIIEDDPCTFTLISRPALCAQSQRPVKGDVGMKRERAEQDKQEKLRAGPLAKLQRLWAQAELAKAVSLDV